MFGSHFLGRILQEQGHDVKLIPAEFVKPFVRQAMPEILENADANLTPRMRNLVSLVWSEWMDLEQQIVAINAEVEKIASSDLACQRLRQIPGISDCASGVSERFARNLNHECRSAQDAVGLRMDGDCPLMPFNDFLRDP